MGVCRVRRRSMRLELEHLTHRYGDRTAIDDLSLVVPVGACLALVGPTGAGKTTLLRLLAGEETATAGVIRVDGRPPGPGDVALVSPAAARTLAVETRAAPPDAGVVAIDDLAGSDPGDGRAHGQLLAALRARVGATLVYATAAAPDALAVADRVAVLEAGRLIQTGAPAELLARPATERVATLCCRPAINLVPAILEKDGQAILIGNQTVSLAGRIAEEFCRDVTVGVQPGHVTLTADGVGWRGRVIASDPYGDRWLVTVDVERIRLRALEAAPSVVGRAVKVRVLPRHFVVFDDRGVRLDQV